MPKITTFPSVSDIPVFAEVADRVEYIADLMEGLAWKRGKSAKVLAKVWNLSKSTVESYSSEASRRIEIDASSLRRLASVQGEDLMDIAYRAGNAKEWAVVVKQLAEISGANAPSKQEVVVSSDANARELMANVFRVSTGKQSSEDENAAEAEPEPVVNDE